MVSLENNGIEYLFDTAEQYREMDTLKEGRIVSRLPSYVHGYGDVYQGGGDYVVKYLGSENPLSGAMQRYFETPHNQNLHEIRVWAEMAQRGEDFMPEIIGWADDFSWIVMQEAEEFGDHRDVEEDLLDAGWAPFDLEIGVFNGEPRVIDAGMMPRIDDDWNVTTDQLSSYSRAFHR